MSVITLKGAPIHTIGTLPPVGSLAPTFTLTKTDMTDISYEEFRGKKLILNIFTSIDTPTCAAAMNNFNEIANEYKNIMILCISADLPFAQKRFCSADNIHNVLALSAFRHPEFGKNYGVVIADSPLAGLLSRAVVVIDEHGRITYTQQVGDIANEPDYIAMKANLI